MLGGALPHLPPAQLEVCVRLAELLRARRQPAGAAADGAAGVAAEGRRGSKRARGEEGDKEFVVCSLDLISG